MISLTPRNPKLSHRKVTLNAYPPAENLKKHCHKKLEATSAGVVEDEKETSLLVCLKEVIQLLGHGDPAKCMYLGEVKPLACLHSYCVVDRCMQLGTMTAPTA